MAIPPDPVTGLPKRKAITDPFGVPHVTAPRVGAQTTTDPFGVPRIQNPPPSPTPAAPLLGGTFTTPSLGNTTPPPPAPGLPDYKGLIENDPVYKQTLADIAAARAADQTALGDAQKRALINFGDVPDLGGYAGLTGDLSGSITDLVKQLAGQNTTAGLSTKARLDRAHGDAVDAVKSSLAARGILSSGETGFQLGREDDAYRQAGYDATQQLIDFLASGQRGFLDSESQRRAALAQAASDAAGRIPPGTTPVAGTGPGGGGAVLDLSPEQQAALQNGQFPLLNLPPTQNIRAAPGFGQTIDLNPGQQADVAAGRFPSLDFPDAGVFPALDLPPTTNTEAAPGFGQTIDLNAGQQADVTAGKFPQLDFPAAAAAAAKPKKKPAAAAGAASVANKIKGKNL